ncbi:unnamed protein product [Amoebophrya sp. A120]|nr:unnamed protein product [Amoebophrya sp. A120]|eukprot:GSA120T00003326001.1
MASPSKKVYDPKELEDDPDLLEYGKWLDLQKKSRQPAVQFETKEYGQIARLCMIPVMHGGPDPPIRGYDYDPEIHAAPPQDENPWELASQLHCTQAMENILNARGENDFLKERKNVISFLGAPGCGKSVLLKLLLATNPNRRDGEDACRVATQYYPVREVEMKKFKVRRYLEAKKGRRGRGSTSSASPSPSPTGRGGRRGSASPSGGAAGTNENNSLMNTTSNTVAGGELLNGSTAPSAVDPQSPTNGAESTSGQQAAASPEMIYDIEDKFFFYRRQFNRFREANGDHMPPLKMPPTEGIHFHHWKEHEVLLLDTTGMNFFGETPEELAAMVETTTKDFNADPGKEKATRKRRKKKSTYYAEEKETETDIWDDSYKNFLPPLLYGLSGILVLCVPYECDYVDFVENTLRAIIAKVRNAPRPALVLVRIRKKRKEDDMRDEAAEQENFDKKRLAEQRRRDRKLQRETKRMNLDSLMGGTTTSMVTTLDGGLTLNLPLDQGDDDEDLEENPQMPDGMPNAVGAAVKEPADAQGERPGTKESSAGGDSLLLPPLSHSTGTGTRPGTTDNALVPDKGDTAAAGEGEVGVAVAEKADGVNEADAEQNQPGTNEPSRDNLQSGIISKREQLEEEEEEEEEEGGRRHKYKASTSFMDEFDDEDEQQQNKSSSSEAFFTDMDEPVDTSKSTSILEEDFLDPTKLDEMLGEKAELPYIKGEQFDFYTTDTPDELKRFQLYFHSIRIFTMDSYPGLTFEKSRRFIKQLQILRNYLFDLQDSMNELKQGPAGRSTVQQDAEYKICLPVWHGLSNYHVLYLLKVLVAWSNLKFPLYMALGAAYITAHVPNVSDLRLVNFQVMRAFVADLLSPRGGRVQESLDLRWTAAISAIARYVVKMGSTLRDQDYWLLQNELMQWLPCSATSKHPETGEISTCSQPRALHGLIHRCDRTGCVWPGEYQTPKWTFNPIEQAVELLAAYEAVVRAPEKLSMTEANMPEHERPDKKDEAFFERTANTGGFDLFSDRVSDQFGPPFCALCFKVMMRDEEVLRELNRDRNREALLETALDRKDKILEEKERKRIEREEKKRIAKEATSKVKKKGLMAGKLRKVLNPSGFRSGSPSSRSPSPGKRDSKDSANDAATPEPKRRPDLSPDSPDYSPVCLEVDDEDSLSPYQRGLRERGLRRTNERKKVLMAQGFGEAAYPDLKRILAEQEEKERQRQEIERQRRMAAEREDLKVSAGHRLLKQRAISREHMRQKSKDDGASTSGVSRERSAFGSPSKHLQEEDDAKVVPLPDIAETLKNHKWYVAKAGMARVEQREGVCVEMDAHLGTIFEKEGYENDCLENNAANEKPSPKKYLSGLTQVETAHSPLRKRDYEARLTTYDKATYLRDHHRTVSERFADIMSRPPVVRDNRGALVVPKKLDENSLESAIIAGVDTEAITREQYMREAQNGFDSEQREWIEQTFRNTSSRYIRFCPDCFGGYKRHYRQRGVPDRNKYEENWQPPERVPEIFEPVPFRNARGHFFRHPYTGEFEAYCEPNPIKNIPKIRINYPETRPYLYERKDNIHDLVIPGGNKEPFRVTMYQDLAIPPILVEQDRKCCALCGKRDANFALVQPCFHRFCLECILDWTDFNHDMSECIAEYELPLPSGTFMGRLADVDKLKPKKWCPVCREHVRKVVLLDALQYSIGDGIVDIEDWAKGQGYVPYPARPQQEPELRQHLEYPTFRNSARKTQWFFEQHKRGYMFMRKLKIKRKHHKQVTAAATTTGGDDAGSEEDA